uniref:Putative ovule protein n=1 Tax=Solanum chacoense TaxID=4108 RepID=A0A0V0HFD5_SOLCH
MACCPRTSNIVFGVNMGMEIEEYFETRSPRRSLQSSCRVTTEGICCISSYKELDRKRNMCRAKGNAATHCRRITSTLGLCR